MSKERYRHKNLKTKSAGYGGVCICPRCGEKGYKYYSLRRNSKTRVDSGVHTQVHHRRYVRPRDFYDRVCYIGMGRL